MQFPLLTTRAKKNLHSTKKEKFQSMTKATTCSMKVAKVSYLH